MYVCTSTSAVWEVSVVLSAFGAPYLHPRAVTVQRVAHKATGTVDGAAADTLAWLLGNAEADGADETVRRVV